MFTLTLKELDSYIDELKRRVVQLEKADVFVGYDRVQGTHYSGFTYVDLIGYLSTGDSSKNLPSRPLLDITMGLHEINTIPFKTSLRNFLSNLKSKPKTKIENIGKTFAEGFMRDANYVFGNESLLTPNSTFTKIIKEASGVNPDAPLVWSGDLQENLSYFYNGKLIFSNKN